MIPCCCNLNSILILILILILITVVIIIHHAYDDGTSHEGDEGANNQNVRWYVKNDSFGPNGAVGLWKNRPSVQELLSIVQSIISEDGNGNANATTTTNDATDAIDRNEKQKNKLATTTTNTTTTTTVITTAILHLIAETSKYPSCCRTGRGLETTVSTVGDTTSSSNLIRTIFAFIGVEPVANINNQTLSSEDAHCAIEILRKKDNTANHNNNSTNNNNNSNNNTSNSNNGVVNFFCPDRDFDQA